MDNNDKIINVLKTYIIAGLIEHDFEKVLSCVTDDVIGIGMGEQGFVVGKEVMLEIMQANINIDNNIIRTLDFQRTEIRFNNATSASICMQVAISVTQNNHATRSGLMQSATMRMENNQWKISAFHASPIIISKESTEAYPLPFADKMISHLKTDLQIDAFDLISKSISGGLISIYPIDNFNLFFINDAMLTYLDYSREEFTEQFSNNVIAIVHPDDIAMTRHIVVESSNIINDIELRVRLIKKCGDIIWVLIRGRSSLDDQNRTVYTGVFTDITDITNLHDKLAIGEERLRIALEKTSNIIFDYDIKTGDIFYPNFNKSLGDYSTKISSAKTSLIYDAEILDEFMPDFEQAFELIRNGSPNSECVVLIEFSDGKKSWKRISLTSINDIKGNPVSAIGMIEDITSLKEVEFAYEREVQYRNSLLADAMVCYEINLSKNRLENCNINSPMCISINPGESYDNMIALISENRVDPAYQKTYLSVFALDKVLQSYQKGDTEITLEYLVCNHDGTKTFVYNILKLIKSSYNDDIKAFMYLLDINDKKNHEIELKRRSETDHMTGLLNKSTSSDAIVKALGNIGEGYYGVFMIMDIDHFKSLNDNYGHPVGDKVLIEVARTMKSKWRSDDILGRIGGDEFCVFFTAPTSISKIKEITAQFCNDISNIIITDFPYIHLTCSIGVTVCTKNSAKNFDKIYKEADDALYTIKKGSRNGYALAKFEI